LANCFKWNNFALLSDYFIYLISYLSTPSLQAVQKLIDEEFEGIVHFRTSTFQKRVSMAQHDFIKLSGSENKLEALMQVTETFLSPLSVR
jgi:hypothetical protein